MLRGVVEPINGAVSSPLQNFETSWLPGIRLELQPSLDSSMLSHAFGQDFQNLMSRHWHGSPRQPCDCFAAPVLPVQHARRRHRSTALTSAVHPEHPRNPECCTYLRHTVFLHSR